jgi:hypothetical protein
MLVQVGGLIAVRSDNMVFTGRKVQGHSLSMSKNAEEHFSLSITNIMPRDAPRRLIRILRSAPQEEYTEDLQVILISSCTNTALSLTARPSPGARGKSDRHWMDE